MKKNILVLILSSVLFLCCHSAYNKQLDEAESCMNTAPQETLSLLQSIPFEDLRSEKEKARYALLYSMALDKNYVVETTDSLMSRAHSYYIRHGSERERMLASYYLGLIGKNAGEYPKALILLADAEAIATRQQDFHQLGLIYMNTAEIYLETYYPDKALAAIHKSIDAYAHNNEDYAVDYSRYLEAQIYIAGYQYDVAAPILDSLATKYSENELFLPEIQLAKAEAYFLSDPSNHEVALSLFQRVIEENKAAFSLGNLADFAYLLEKNGEASAADEYLSYIASNSETAVDSATYYNACYNVFDARGDYRAAEMALQNAVRIQNDVFASASRQSVNRTLESYYQNKMIQEKRSARIQRVSFIVISLILLMLLCAVVSSFLLLRRKHRKIVLEDMATIEYVKSDLETQKAKNEQAGNIIESFVKERVEALQQLSNLYFSWDEGAVKKRDKEKGIDTRDEVINAFRKQLEEIRNNQGFITDLEQNLNLSENGILIRFRKEYEGTIGKKIKDEEMEFIILVFSGLSIKSICYLLNMSEAAARMRKTRLKKHVEQFSPELKDECMNRLQ